MGPETKIAAQEAIIKRQAAEIERLRKGLEQLEAIASRCDRNDLAVLARYLLEGKP
jgi:hypothetical protein